MTNDSSDGRRSSAKIISKIVLERIREIRASEGRFYHKIIDIYALSDVLDCEKLDLDGFIEASSKVIEA